MTNEAGVHDQVSFGQGPLPGHGDQLRIARPGSHDEALRVYARCAWLFLFAANDPDRIEGLKKEVAGQLCAAAHLHLDEVQPEPGLGQGPAGGLNRIQTHRAHHQHAGLG